MRVGLQDGDAVRVGQLPHGRRRLQLVAASARPIRLRDDGDDLMAATSADASSVGTANAGVPK